MLKGKLSVVMPAYNEAAFIESNVAETVQTLVDLGYDFEIIVVDDGSADDTHLSAVRVRGEYPRRVRVVRYERNQGKGNALTCGARYASGDYVAFLDADMDLHPRQLSALFDVLEREQVDAVIGSKRHPLSDVNYPAKRRIYSNAYYLLVKTLFGLPVRDTQTGIKLFKADLLHNILPRLVVKRFAFDIELLANAHRRGYKICEAPVKLEFQRIFDRIRIPDVWKILVDTAAIAYRMHILRYYDKLPGVAEPQLASGWEAREVELAEIEL